MSGETVASGVGCTDLISSEYEHNDRRGREREWCPARHGVGKGVRIYRTTHVVFFFPKR